MFSWIRRYQEKKRKADEIIARGEAAVDRLEMAVGVFEQQLSELERKTEENA